MKSKIEQLENENHKLRSYMWLNHGCPFSCLYGDDGEMQCNNTVEHKPIDFKRMDVDEILIHLKERTVNTLISYFVSRKTSEQK